MPQRIDSAQTRRILALLPCAIGLIFISFPLKPIADTVGQEASPPRQERNGEGSLDGMDEEDMIEGTADDFEQYETQGLTIFIGNVKIDRPDGFLNGDKVEIYKDIETDEVIKTVAEGNVELRDGDIFATCNHAVLNHVTDIVELQDNVIVIQNEDRLEADFFTFDRRTGKRTGKGNIKFKVRVKEKEESP